MGEAFAIDESGGHGAGESNYAFHNAGYGFHEGLTIKDSIIGGNSPTDLTQ
jgi:hypothetical protein